jgi:protein-disulfide isomerase
VAGLTRGTPPTQGPEGAPVTLTVFSDFQCPYCARLASMLKEVLPEQEGRVRVIFRHFPLGMHPWAEPAAEAAACAQEQGNSHFWRVHDFVFEHQRELTPKNFAEKRAGYTRTLSGFDQRKFEGCVAEKKTAARIQQDIAFGNQIGVEGTPTMFVNSEKIGNVVAPEQLRTPIRASTPGRPSRAWGPRAEPVSAKAAAKRKAGPLPFGF